MNDSSVKLYTVCLAIIEAIIILSIDCSVPFLASLYTLSLIHNGNDDQVSSEIEMAQYGISQGHGHPVPPAQNNGLAPWTSEPPTPAHYPASQHINNPNGYSYGAPNAVLCQTPEGVTGFMIWHGDPNAFPAVAQIQYGNGSIYPTSYPSQAAGWGPMPPPTPDSALISTQGFLPRHDPSFPVIQYQPKLGKQDGVSVLPKRNVPRVMPIPSAGEIDLLKLGEWHEQALAVPVPVPEPEATVTQTGETQTIEPRPVVESTVRAIDLLTQPMTCEEPSYILSGEGQEGTVSDGSIEETAITDVEAISVDISEETVENQSKSPNILEDNGGSSTGREPTKSLEPSPLILSSSLVSPERKQPKTAKPRTPVKRLLAINNVQRRKKRPTRDGTSKPPTSSYAPGTVRLPATSGTTINLEDNVRVRPEVEVPWGSATPKETTEEAHHSSLFPSSPNWEAEMNSLFDFSGASLAWTNQPFWKDEDPAQTGQHGCPGHAIKVFRGSEKAPFSLDPWVDDELKMPLWAV